MNAQQLYNNEDYVLQIDSHSRFIKNWDTELVNMLDHLRYRGEKPLLTTYGASYEPNKKIDDLNPPPYKLVPVDFKESGTIWFKRKIIEGYEKKTEPINARFIGGGFFFTYGFSQHVSMKDSSEVASPQGGFWFPVPAIPLTKPLVKTGSQPIVVPQQLALTA